MAFWVALLGEDKDAAQAAVTPRGNCWCPPHPQLPRASHPGIQALSEGFCQRQWGRSGVWPWSLGKLRTTGLTGSAKGDTQNHPKLAPSIPIFQLQPPIHAANCDYMCVCVCVRTCKHVCRGGFREALLHHLPRVQGMQEVQASSANPTTEG